MKIKISDKKNKGKSVLIGNGSILTIEGTYSENDNCYSCSIIHSETGKKIKNITVPINNCVESEKDGIDFECIKKEDNSVNIGADEDVDILTIDDIIGKNIDFLNNDIRVLIKHFKNPRKVVKTTQKSVYFIDETGKRRYTSHRNIKKIYKYISNYKPEIKEPDNPEKTEDRIIIDPVPDNINFLKEKRNVFIDIKDKKGLKVLRTHQGKLFWKDQDAKKYSATLLDKINKKRDIIVYEMVE